MKDGQSDIAMHADERYSQPYVDAQRGNSDASQLP